MEIYIILGVVASILVLLFLVTLICFLMTFYNNKRKPLKDNLLDYPKDPAYERLKDQLVAWRKRARALDHKNFSITSFDGLTLRAKYYENIKGAPIEIMFHGYKSYGERDMSGGIERCFAMGKNAFIVEQRGCGESDGHVVTFGINESKDCLKWIDFVLKEFGSDTKIVITGISLGAATVMTAAAKDLPKNVKYALADCGFSSPKEIICDVVKRKKKLPPKIFYPFIKLGARIFGKFNLEESSAHEGVKSGKLPIIFFHGNEDDFVPCYMSQNLYEECKSPKKLVIIDKAVHGLAYPQDKEKYLTALKEFEKEIGFEY